MRPLGAEAAGITVGAAASSPWTGQQRTNVPHIFAIGDVVGQPMLAHKATHEGKVAAEVAAGQKSHFDARVIPSVAYTDPEIAWAGGPRARRGSRESRSRRPCFPGRRADARSSLGRDEGFTKLLFDPATRRVVGGGIVGTNAGEL